MPELHFKGKEYVFNHHLTVPFRPLVAYPGKSILASPAGRGAGAGGEDRSEGKGGNENLIIHGDNLHALKALLPRYAGKVDCVFIDPPYNTGNENWNYNDNVNSPIIKEWLDGNPVNKEDMLRHDKWCCMMYPRLKLLHELLSERGSFWMTLDDNEIHRARLVMDEIYGEENFIENFIWQKKYSPQNDAEFFSSMHDHIVVYSKNSSIWERNLEPRSDEQYKAYKTPKNDPRGLWKSSDLTRAEHRDRDYYGIETPCGKVGSATPAQAVIAQNATDGGNRRFILVECEDYADSLTAERVRRVVNGYEFQGVQKEELLREKITWSNFSGERARRKILDQVDAIKNLDSSGFDSIKSTIKNGELIVTGENRITEKVEGLGGGFTYYTLGEPIDLDKMLTGESLPDYISLGAWLFHTATGEPLDEEGIREKDSYLGESAAFHAWLIYKPDLDFLKSRESALTLDFAEAIAKHKGKRHLVFAPSRFASNKTLSPMGVEFAPLPFALYRLEKE